LLRRARESERRALAELPARVIPRARTAAVAEPVEAAGGLRVQSGAGAEVRPVRRVRLMGATFADVSEAEAVRIIVEAAIARRGHWTITANLDHLRRYTLDGHIRELVDDADMVVADGTPLVWASRIAGAPICERVAGSDMVWSICAAASRSGGSVYLLGGDSGVADHAAGVLLERHPELDLVGTSCPPVGFEKDAAELARIERELLQARPQIVFVALGFPKQDVLIKRLRRVLPEASFIGVGISLSFVAGDITRAPAWLQRLGLEWLHRLIGEPRRLVRRYLLQGMPFALSMFASGLCFRLLGAGGERWGVRAADAATPTSLDRTPEDTDAMVNDDVLPDLAS
jgi:N-acetylglucosaminyldiphosphoundecaprenol N-acetyl-beta-D-mannosaminyltransferase